MNKISQFFNLRIFLEILLRFTLIERVRYAMYHTIFNFVSTIKISTVNVIVYLFLLQEER